MIVTIEEFKNRFIPIPNAEGYFTDIHTGKTYGASFDDINGNVILVDIIKFEEKMEKVEKQLGSFLEDLITSLK